MASEDPSSKDLTRSYSALRIDDEGHDEEELEIDIPKDAIQNQVVNLQWAFIKTFWFDKPMPKYIPMKNSLAALWRPVFGVQLTEKGPNRFQFRFLNEIDFERVLEGAPWTFDIQLLVFKVLDANDNPFTVPLYHMPIWVQIFDVPTGFMSEAIAKSIGNRLGTYICSDPNNFTVA